MGNSKGWLEFGVYLPNLEGGRKLMEKQMTLWTDKWALRGIYGRHDSWLFCMSGCGAGFSPRRDYSCFPEGTYDN